MGQLRHREESGNGQFEEPLGIAADSSNNVYVTDYRYNHVEKFDSNGNYLMQWGSNGSGNGQFSYPYGIAVDSGNNVYVADGGNSRVEEFDSSGNYLTQWGSYGSGNGQFNGPEGIAVDSTGNAIYVADRGNYRIEAFVNITTGGAFGLTNGVFGFNVSGPSGSTVVIQASTDLRTWIPLQTNLLGSGPLYFSDPQSPNNVQRFYRAQLLP
jgi:DNA-binding beta-propeller fold protein YncE